jgi:DNA polymerase-3 subunit delta'
MSDPGPMADDLLPWHVEPWEHLWRAWQADRLPHALLLAGPLGVGKRRLADLLARALLCRLPRERGLPCGECADCLLLSAGTHPDRLAVSPDPQSKSREITVSAIRELADTDALTAHRGGWKVILIEPAHRMNTSAANALLKTLEEPTPGTLIVLVTELPSRLMATIRSRCQRLALPAPPEPSALEWLAGRVSGGHAVTLLRLAHGAPLRALELADGGALAERDRLFQGFAEAGSGKADPVAVAAGWIKVEPTISLDWLGGWLSDLLRLTTDHPDPRLINIDKKGPLASLASRLDPAAGHRLLRRVWEARAADFSNLNVQLLYESLLVEWAKVMRA